MKSALFSLYGVQFYSVVITIFATPLLIKFLGTEGYGLIGLYFVIQMLLQVVDGGLTGTITKLTAQLNLSNLTDMTGLNKSYQYFQGFLNKAVLILLFISAIVYQTEAASSLIESSLPESIIDMSVLLMIACVAIRFLSLPDRGLLQGLERQKTLALTNFTIVTLRYPVAVAMLGLLGADVVHFFCFQLLVVLVEVAILKYFSLSYLKSEDISGDPKVLDNGINLDLKWLIKQAGSLWIISVLWVLVSQVDKLVLSFSVPLEAYGIFSLALISANLMLTMFVPINQVLMPRFGTIQFYVCFFSVVASGLYIFGEELLFLWTRSSELSEGASVFLGYLAIGNFIHGITNIIFITSYARGDLAEYAKRYMIHVSVILPISVYSAIAYQEYGVVLVWVFGAFGFFLHTAVPLLRRIFEFRTALVAIVSASFQIMLTSGAMYLFKSQFTLVAYPNLDFLILLTGLALLLLIINYLISHVSIRHSYG
jgi:O-antigen/teichoic acid export membrane protein